MISVVAVVRNDDYGLNLEQRLFFFFKSLELCPFQLEIVLVEWNPPSENIRFIERYKDIFPKKHKIKIVTVDNHIHKKINNSDKFNVFEYYGKNCGIRNSSYDYILITNPDNIFIPSLWEEIKNVITPHSFFRTHRVDITPVSDFNFNYDISKIIENFELIKIQDCGKGLSIKQLIDGDFSYHLPFTCASGDFILSHKNNFMKVKGFEESGTFSHIDSKMVNKLINNNVNQVILKNYTLHIDHSRPNVEISKNFKLETNISKEYENTDEWGLINEKLTIKEL